MDIEEVIKTLEKSLVVAEENGVNPIWITCDAVRTIIAMMKEHEWIPVEERLPEEPFGCLVTVWDSKPNCVDDFPNILPYFVGWDGEQWNESDGERCPFEVIAWMKLPEPYQPKD